MATATDWNEIPSCDCFDCREVRQKRAFLSTAINDGIAKRTEAYKDRIGTAAERKAAPIVTGCIDYFPDALIAIAGLSKAANDKHNPGEPLHWSREKSNDHVDCAVRHLIDRGEWDEVAGVKVRHMTEAAWRLLAALQIEIEKDKGLPPSRGSR